MTSVDYLRSFVDYNYAVNRQVWDSIGQLSDEQFIKPIPYSHGSIRNLMLHMAVVDRRFLKGLKGEADARTYTEPEAKFPTKASVRQYYDRVERDVLDYVTRLDPEQWEQKPDGTEGLTVAEVLLHLVNHGTDHRAQVLRALNDFGAPTFSQDYLLYLISRTK